MSNAAVGNVHLTAYSVEHDGECEVERSVTFHEAVGEGQPAFARYRLSWTDALGCRHFVRYDLEIGAEASDVLEPASNKA